jgi:hypothetical protein
MDISLAIDFLDAAAAYITSPHRSSQVVIEINRI